MFILDYAVGHTNTPIMASIWRTENSTALYISGMFFLRIVAEPLCLLDIIRLTISGWSINRLGINELDTSSMKEE